MYNFKVSDEKEYKVKFGYKPTLKENIVSRFVKIRQTDEELTEAEQMEKLEEALLFLPEALLVGLQVHHKDEFGYDYDSKDGKSEKVDIVMDLIDEYTANDGDPTELLSALENELLTDSFLSNLFRQAVEAEEKKTTPKKTATKKTTK